MRYYRKLINFTDSLIRGNKSVKSDGYFLDINDLHESDLQEFAAHFILVDCEEHSGWDWIFEDVYKEELASTFSNLILTYDKDHKQDLKECLIEGLKKSAIKAFSNRMQQLVDERIGIVFSEDDYSRGEAA